MIEISSHFAGGRRHRGTGPAYDVVSPIDESPAFRVVSAGAAELEAAIAGAQRATSAMADLEVTSRSEILRALAKTLIERGPELAAAITKENGCPSRQALAMQVQSAVALLNAYADLVESHLFEEYRTGMRGGRVLVQKLPIGVSVGIVPWNVPVFLACMKIAPAVAAGCPIVIKPSIESAPSSDLFADAVASLDVPAGAISIVTGDAEFGKRLVADPRVAKVSFTGSSAAGRHVAMACASRLARVTLELGGKSAGILLDDVDLDAILPDLLGATLQNNGQVCGAQTRLLIPSRRFAELTARIASAFDGLHVGDPREPDTDIGPLVSAAQRDNVRSAIATALAAGARIAGSGRDRTPARGFYVAPVLLADVSPAMPIAREEVFGPAIVAIPYASDDEAVALANDSAYGLSGSVWSSDRERAERVARRLNTGTVGINSKKILDFGSPFGGMRASGIGRELGHEGIDAYLEAKSVLLPA